ncbi:AAA family ATPase [Methanocaldococcus sp.]|uniref:ParA family protein n=1 Tax=Methanocaldococcus sp. TaxID=2152917 RepID=UPI002602A8C1|nr:AAA family ATPase [Methanocaldococcus sp.]MCQ6254535.1 AAA family ATPase [Methanocaldococcus sp.]
MAVISIANQKGGVGKTTIALNLSYTLAENGYDTLVIDLDPQFNLSFGILGMKLLDYTDKNIGTLLSKNSVKKKEIEESIVKINDRLDLIPSHLQLSAVEKMLVNAYATVEKAEREGMPVFKFESNNPASIEFLKLAKW